MVSLRALDGFLKRHGRIGIDSNILIYLIEDHPEYRRLAQKVFASIETGRNFGVCATLSLLEVLVQPYRNDVSDVWRACVIEPTICAMARALSPIFS